MRAHNFCAGPAAMPVEVLQQIKDEMFDWQNQGASVMEVSHRSPAIATLIEELTADVKSLLQVPDNYKIVFMHGGATGQFFAVPMNLLGKNKKAAYLSLGIWSGKAVQEAKRYGDITVAATLDESKPLLELPPEETWQYPSDAAYLHYTDNETVAGIEFPTIPSITDVPLVADMSSNLFSRQFDVSRHGVIYACAQKNFGLAGFALAIVREDLLDQAMPETPSIFSYKEQVEAGSRKNTPATFSMYVAKLIMEWMQRQGGVAAMEAHSAHKAKKIYDVIDAYDIYQNRIIPPQRSRMNPTFFLPDDEMQARFLEQAQAQHLSSLKGHRSRGGIRASLYNAVTTEDVDVLASFMKDFAEKG